MTNKIDNNKTLKRANEILGANYDNWARLSLCESLTEDFIQEFKDKVDWICISRYPHLSEDFIRKFADRGDWYYISAYQYLSENFIREFADRVAWDWIVKYQPLYSLLIVVQFVV